MKLIKRTISCAIQKQRNKDGSMKKNALSIVLSISYCGVSYRCNTGITCDLDEWDPKTKAVRPNIVTCQSLNSNDVNYHLQLMMAEAQSLFREYEYNDKIPLMVELKCDLKDRFVEKGLGLTRKADRFSRKNTPYDVRTLYTEYVDFLKTKRHIKDSSYERYLSLYKEITKAFPTNSALDFKKGDIDKFIEQLSNEGLKPSTIKQRVVALKSFLKWMKEHRDLKLPDNVMVYETLVKALARPVIYLERDEIERFEKLEVRGDQEFVKYVFLLCCYTGLRISDACNLRWTNVRESSILLVTKKRMKPVEIELNKGAKKVLSYFKSIRKPETEDYVLPDFKGNTKVLVNKMREHLNTLAKKAGITDVVNMPIYNKGKSATYKECEKWQVITSHVGRKTFIVQALSAGIPAAVVMTWTGHASLDSMKPYINITRESSRKGMERLDDALFSR